jgi:hypothetical protein
MVSDAVMMGASPQMEAPEEMGRATDTVLGHLSLGEVVIPRALLDDPEVLQAVQSIFEAYGVNMGEFTVGDPANKINPETGYPEFFFKKIFRTVKKVLKSPIGKIATIGGLSYLLPGLGTALGSGLGAGAAAAPIIGNSLIGAGIGAATGGGLKGALLGGATGGIGGAFSSGAFGTAAGTPLAGGLQGPTQGTGLVGALTRGVSGTGLGNVSNLVRPASSIFDAVQQSGTQDDMEEQLLAAQGRAQEAIKPYSQLGLQGQQQLATNLQEGFNPTDLQNDPGYQYRLQQGNEQLQRSLAAQGLSGSGSAIKAAQELGQGLAANQYDTAYNQWLQQNNQLAGLGGSGQAAAGDMANIYGNQGNIKANASLEKSNILSNTLSSVLGQRIIGYDPTTGRPIYG